MSQNRHLLFRFNLFQLAENTHFPIILILPTVNAVGAIEGVVAIGTIAKTGATGKTAAVG